MAQASDPRNYFAAERTLLAWLRTGLAIIGLGFVVSRFGLFLRAIGQDVGNHRTTYGSAGFGVALVVLGGLAIYGAAWQHVRFCRRLTALERPQSYWMGFATWVSLVVATSAIVLAIFLVMT